MVVLEGRMVGKDRKKCFTRFSESSEIMKINLLFAPALVNMLMYNIKNKFRKPPIQYSRTIQINFFFKLSSHLSIKTAII